MGVAAGWGSDGETRCAAAQPSQTHGGVVPAAWTHSCVVHDSRHSHIALVSPPAWVSQHTLSASSFPIRCGARTLQLFGDFYTGEEESELDYAERRMRAKIDDCSLPQKRAREVEARATPATPCRLSCVVTKPSGATGGAVVLQLIAGNLFLTRAHLQCIPGVSWASVL